MTIGVVQEQTGAATGTSMSASWVSPTTAGNLLLAIVLLNNSRDITSKPNGWRLLASYQDDELAETWLVYEIPAAASRSGSEDFTSNLSNTWRITLIELSNVDAEAYVEVVKKFANPGDSIAHEPQRRGVGYALFAVVGGSNVNGFDAASSTGSWTVLYSGNSVLVRANAVPGQPLDARIVDEASSWRGVYLGIAEQHTDLRPPARSTDVQTFTASGTWLKPDGAREVNVICIGGGGGAGSGRKGAAGTARTAGGGGSGGAYSQAVLDPDDLASSVAVTVGAGGTGGAAQTVDSTNGNAGTAGGTSSFGSYLAAVGGNAGAAGATGAASGGAATTGPQTDSGGAGAASQATGGQGVNPAAQNTSRGPSGGGSGGGRDTANTVRGGGAGGTHNIYGATAGGAGGSASPGSVGATGPTVAGFVGLGGGGGGTGTGGSFAGGNGGLYGGGGGSGAAGTDASMNSGAGGNGGNGVVIVTTIF